MKAKLQWVQYSMPCELWCLPFWLVGPGTVPGSVWDLGTVCKSFFSASFPKPSTWGGPSADYSFLFGSPFPVCCPTDAIQYHGLHSDSSLLCLDTPPLVLWLKILRAISWFVIGFRTLVGGITVLCWDAHCSLWVFSSSRQGMSPVSPCGFSGSSYWSLKVEWDKHHHKLKLPHLYFISATVITISFNAVNH